MSGMFDWFLGRDAPANSLNMTNSGNMESRVESCPDTCNVAEYGGGWGDDCCAGKGIKAA
jgi:hypothetical protein